MARWCREFLNITHFHTMACKGVSFCTFFPVIPLTQSRSPNSSPFELEIEITEDRLVVIQGGIKRWDLPFDRTLIDDNYFAIYTDGAYPFVLWMEHLLPFSNVQADSRTLRTLHEMTCEL